MVYATNLDSQIEPALNGYQEISWEVKGGQCDADHTILRVLIGLEKSG